MEGRFRFNRTPWLKHVVTRTSITKFDVRREQNKMAPKTDGREVRRFRSLFYSLLSVDQTLMRRSRS
jgi:hypothetical protein